MPQGANCTFFIRSLTVCSSYSLLYLCVLYYPVDRIVTHNLIGIRHLAHISASWTMTLSFELRTPQGQSAVIAYPPCS